MNFEDFISSTADPRPRKIVIYGTAGIGKTSLAAKVPWQPAIFLPTEDGYQDIKPAVSKLTQPGKRLLESVGDIYQGVDLLLKSEHKFGCVILDSAEATEKIIEASVAAEAGKQSIAEIGFGKGHDKAATIFNSILAGFNALVEKGMFVVVLAHSEVERFNNPTGDSYDRFNLRLSKRTAPLLSDWADEIFFANYKVYTTEKEGAFGQKTVKAIGAGERVLYTTERPSHHAKNRLCLPDEMPMPVDASAFWNSYTSAMGL